MSEEISVKIETVIGNLNDAINRLSSSLTSQIQKLTETVSDLKSDVRGTLVQHRTISIELEKSRKVANKALSLAELNAVSIENLSSKFKEQKKRTDERKTFFSQTSSKIIGTVVAVFIVAVLSMMYESVAIERKMLDDHRSKVVQVQTPPNSSPDNQTTA